MPKLRPALFIAYTLLTLLVFLATLFSPAFRAVAYAPLRELIVPPPEPIVVSIFYSTEKEAWLQEVIVDFERTHPTVNGHPVQLEMEKMGSREMYLAVLDGAQPDVVSPASSLQIALLQELSRSRFGRSLVNPANRSQCRPVVTTPLVLVGWQERAGVLFDNCPQEALWQCLHDAVVNSAGWSAYNHPEWGYVKFGQTNPLKSNSGFMAIVLMTYNYLGKDQGLQTQDFIGNDAFEAWFFAFQNTIGDFGDSTGTYMREIVAYGPSKYDVVAVYEATAIEYIEEAPGRYGQLQLFYPPKTILSDHPFCTLDATWVTPEKEKAAQLFIDFLLSKQAQEAALLRHGFRPVDPRIDIEQRDSPFSRYQARGVQIDLPPEVELPAGDVLDALLDFWSRNISP